MAITCCHYCVPPKRHTACWDHCPEYLEQKAKHDAQKEAEFKKNEVSHGIYRQRSISIKRVTDKRRRKGNGVSAKVIK